MRKFKNLVIGGIETKIFNLILITVLMLTGAFIGVTVYQGNTLRKVTTDTAVKQQETSSAIISGAMAAVTEASMTRTTDLQARLVGDLFRDVQQQVSLVAGYATKLFAYPEKYPIRSYSGPDLSLEGKVSSRYIWAEGVDQQDPAIIARAGLVSNLSELMISLCESAGMDNVYIGVEEGFFVHVNRTPSEWFTKDGHLMTYDARDRFWYQQAAEAGSIVFSDLETDATTGELSVVCAMPVYGPGRKLAAVVGSDLFLHSMQDMLEGFTSDGGYIWIMNQDGHVIYSPNQEVMAASAQAEDLRTSSNAPLAALAADALKGRTDIRLINVHDQDFYMLGEPIDTVGWTLFAAFPKAKVDQLETTLLGSYDEINAEARTAYAEESGRSQRSTVILMVLLTLLAGAGALILGKHFVRPLNRITKRIASLRGGDLEFKMEDTYRTGDEIEVLAESFAGLSHKTLEYVEQVRQATAEKERIGTELQMANRIQESMLPHVFPPFPDRTEFDIYATMDPAREVGGDFYDFFMIDRDHLCLVMADVSGKGVPAALFMMISKTILQSCALLGQSAGAILAKTNEALCSNNQVEMFVTVWLGILEISTGRMSCANAGHEYPAVFSEQCTKEFSLLKDKHGFVIGGMAGVRYKEYEFRMNPGDKLFVYTDGVPEATNSAEEMFGTERMIQVLNEHPESTPKELLTTVKQSVDSFVGDADQFDDLTMLCLEYRGPEAKPAAGADAGTDGKTDA